MNLGAATSATLVIVGALYRCGPDSQASDEDEE
jgi:hypothetical protein